MAEPVEPRLDGTRHLGKSRMIGKLFGREKKPTINNDDEVSAFLHGPSDKLYMTTSPVLPKFPKLDTSSAPRWPTAAEVNRSRDTSRRRSASPKRSKKGLIVRFTDNQPEIIGEGGDEAESPTLEISERKRSYSHPPIIQRTSQGNDWVLDGWFADNDSQKMHQALLPWPTSASRGGQEAVVGLGTKEVPNRVGNSTNFATSKSLQVDEGVQSNSASARMKAEMRAAEGRAFKVASKSFEAVNKSASTRSNDENGLVVSVVPIRKPFLSPFQLPIQTAPGSCIAQPGKDFKPENSTATEATAVAVNEAAFNDFSNRIQYLYILFSLSAESVSPISGSSLGSWIRAASWWFIKGRASIERAIRLRPSSPNGRRNCDNLQQQGHADVAKAVWIMRDILASHAELKVYKTDDLTDLTTIPENAGDEYLADITERSQAIMVNLKMLCMSMQRNNCLPPLAEDAPLPQGLDTSIWITYPSLPPDIVAILSERGEDITTDQGMPRWTKVSNAMPLGDTKTSFEYARFFVDIFIMGGGAELEQYSWPCILFVSRAHTAQNLAVTISSQNGHIALGIKASGESGLTWTNVEWQTRMHAIEIKLPGGFLARVLCSSSDFTTLWNIYDYTEKVHANLRPRKDEEVVFESTFKTFQYFDRDLKSRIFPKEPISNCQVRVFEKSLTEPAGRGARKKYQGFRIAVITGKKTKNLNGISQDMSPRRPLQYGFMRGEEGAPALLLKFDDGIRKSTMVFTFDKISERVQLFSCITGGIRNDEKVLAYLPVKDYSLTYVPRLDSFAIQHAFDDFEWQGVQIINMDHAKNFASDKNPTVLSDNLRIILDSKSGSITDRINVEPGEMKIRLNTQLSTNEIAIFRQPQEDLSISLLESHVSKDVPEGVIELLEKILSSQTIRKFCFHGIEDLHSFQTALTGFSVLFDSTVESFVISRKRSVVPIHKKWEASFARLQILQLDKVVQIAAFFDDFKHGECMNFIVKATDVFESSNRSSKYYLRIVDGKFALPKGGEDNYGEIDKGFVCLDMPDYPGEHDDINITFDSELGKFATLVAFNLLTFKARDKFSKALPASVRSASRLGTMKK